MVAQPTDVLEFKNREELFAAIDTDCQAATSLIEQLRGGAVRRLPMEQLTEVLAALSNNMPYFGYGVSGTELPTVFRGRVLKSDSFIRNTAELSYRNPRKEGEFGRCHCPGETMFYCSNNAATMLAELTPEVGDKVYVGVATIAEGKKLRCIAVGEIDYSRRYGRPFVGNRDAFAMLNGTLEKIKDANEERHARILVTDAYFSDLFAQQARREIEYRPTSILAGILLNLKDYPDALAFPSVEHRGGINFAIKPASFDSKMKWEEFYALDIRAYFGFGIYKTSILATAKPSEGTGDLNWQEV